MSPEINNYRLTSLPDVVLHLGSMTADEIATVEGHLMDRQSAITKDLGTLGLAAECTSNRND